MATHSSILAWKIPWTEKPGGLQSTELQSQTWLITHICKGGVKRIRGQCAKYDSGVGCKLEEAQKRELLLVCVEGEGLPRGDDIGGRG